MFTRTLRGNVEHRCDPRARRLRGLEIAAWLAIFTLTPPMKAISSLRLWRNAGAGGKEWRMEEEIAFGCSVISRISPVRLSSMNREASRARTRAQ